MKGLFCLLTLVCFLFAGATAWGANVINPSGFTRIDTFGADVTIDLHRLVAEHIIVTAYTSAKTVTFIDQSAAVALVFEVPAGETVHIEGWVFPEGAIFDQSASDLAAGDFIFIQAK